MKIDTKDSITVNDLIDFLQRLKDPNGRVCFPDDGINLKDDLSYDANNGCYILTVPTLEKLQDTIDSLEAEKELLEEENKELKDKLKDI